MERRERIDIMTEAVLAALTGWQSGLWTAMPAIVQSFNAAEMTISAQPSIQAKITQPDGSKVDARLPLLLDCPVVFQGGGGFTLTFPIQPGDEALIVFASRCIDSWWYSGGVGVQAEMRMHDLSDGFALVGVRSRPRALPVSTQAAQLRSDDGATFIEIAPGGVVKVQATIAYVDAPNVNVSASNEVRMDTPNLKVTGEVTVFEGTPEEFRLGAFRDVYDTHTHRDVQPGAGNSGIPNQQVP